MPISHDHIRATTNAYLDAHPEDKHELAPLFDLLDTGADVTSRKEMRGHVTAGAVLLDASGRVLHIHHNALNTWLLPGGHVEDTDTTLAEAALRELVEEAGLNGAAISLAHPEPAHIDIHPIPANPAKNEGDHQHIDYRFVFRLDRDADVALQGEEVSGYAWKNADVIVDESLRSRVLPHVA
ncbi:NUDIX domain-containing protein [Streptomyces sp. NBC_00249]|uniref:NUDIX hydrolase n=1 Tax=Streptomyces sp. NBC_00249 TaxID=2975690 RepID=UPI0022571F7E|nr:NUDIX domain-containing protein [Streptomyces sp. NBC_00249]MCX5195777.1 NUDIX domain-containing protein [Streptomyces sp. NBC_00249]